MNVPLPDQAWVEFDALTAGASGAHPWAGGVIDGLRFVPDFELLAALLSVPLRLGATTQSGIPAKAVDVWVAHELRRAGFDPDDVWPRATSPRVLPREVALLRTALPKRLADELFARLDAGSVRGGVTAANATILGKAYVKQVDVVMAQWSRGPEILISTKRMDSSFGKNALNRIEESYGDSKNLRGRHPLAATGFMFVMRSTAFVQERDTALRLLDLLAKLAAEPDGYDATGLVVVEWADEQPGPASAGANETAQAAGVSIRHDLIPPELQPARFLSTIVGCVLDRTPVDHHRRARQLRGQEVPDDGVPGEGPAA